MPNPSPRLATVPVSGIRRIYERALAIDGVTMLSVGEPDVPVAPHIAEAAKGAWDRDETDYTANAGILPLRQAFVDRFAASHGASLPVGRVWVTIGGTQALHQALGLVLGEGDEVLVPDPGYTTFSMSPRMIGAVPVPYALRPEAGFQPDPDRIEALVTPRTRAIIVNSPSNPLGTVLDEAGSRAILDFARRHDLWVISDEVYSELTWSARHVSLTALDRDDRVLGVFSLSKTYAMTGVRVGFLVAPEGFADALRTAQEAMISCVAVPDQVAGTAALAGDQGHVAQARAHYRANLEAATALLRERGIGFVEPAGAFYLWIDLRHTAAERGEDIDTWAHRFLVEQRIAVAPGSAFGRSGEGWVRVCAAATRDDLVRGISALPAP